MIFKETLLVSMHAVSSDKKTRKSIRVYNLGDGTSDVSGRCMGIIIERDPVGEQARLEHSRPRVALWEEC